MDDTQFVHKVIVFNRKNPHHVSILNWLDAKTSNFSAFGMETLSMRKEGFSLSQSSIIQEETTTEGWL